VRKRVTRSRKKKPPSRALSKGLRVSAKVLLLLLILTFLQVLILKFVNPPSTTRMAYHWLKGKIGQKDDYRPRYQWRPLNKISSHLAKAVLAAEDQRFLSHHGFDFVELNDALQDMAAGERLRGASTITMQAARSVFLWPGRSLLRKSLEAYYTVLIELVWGKRRILEIYLNTVDWGTDVVGAEAASRKYFQRSANSLSPEEGALLAAILPSPHTWSPVNPTEYVREKQNSILKDMKHMRIP
jgi:monofunctional biosynthetic peptidoglycan transglycosylase